MKFFEFYRKEGGGVGGEEGERYKKWNKEAAKMGVLTNGGWSSSDGKKKTRRGMKEKNGRKRKGK